jgi:putative DNA primase/helicase
MGNSKKSQPSKGLPSSELHSDFYFADLLYKRFGHDLRYTPNIGWHSWRDGKWVNDSRYDFAGQAVRDLLLKRGKGREHQSAGKHGSVLLAAEVKKEFKVIADQWDSERDELNTPSGLINLKSGEVNRDNYRPLVTKITGCEVGASSHCPQFKDALSEIFNPQQWKNPQEVIDFFQVLFGYLLTGQISEQYLFFFHGVGANGKSFLLDLMKLVGGDYVRQVPSSLLVNTRNRDHPTELAQLMGVRLAVSSELESNQFWAESLIKTLTGDQTITARFMRQDYFEFQRQAGFIVAGNHKPRFNASDQGMTRRLVLIPFRHTIPPERRKPDLHKLIFEEEGPAILRWVIEGAMKWYQLGLVLPAEIKEETGEYVASNDDIAAWVEECAELEPAGRVSNQQLLASYNRWKENQGEKGGSIKPFLEKLLTRYPELKKDSFKDNGKTVRGVRGIQLDVLYAFIDD